MKKVLFIVFTCILASIQGQAQLGNFISKAKNKLNSKVNQRIDKKTDKAMEEALDAAEGKGSSSNSSPAGATTDAGEKSAAPSLKSYSKFDFVPGEKIIYTDDFSGDEIGQLPLHWNTRGKGEVVTMDKEKGNWLRLFPTAVYLPGNTQPFTKNFTIEFDIVFDMHNTGYSYPYFSFGFLSSGTLAPNDNELLISHNKGQAAEIFISLASGGGTSTYIETFAKRQSYFRTEAQELSLLEKYYGKKSHICVQVQESRLRVWFNGEKKFDLPRALATDEIFNNLFFRTYQSSYRADQLGFYITDLKVATGLPDTRHKLVEEGKFSTTGILFDVNTATIKPESNGVLKELADILKKHGDIRIKIIGHTDADGSDAANLELSKKRSEAVKTALQTEFAISADRMETDGKGESEPAGDNKTKEGKAQNRRVEFIKL